MPVHWCNHRISPGIATGLMDISTAAWPSGCMALTIIRCFSTVTVITVEPNRNSIQNLINQFVIRDQDALYYQGHSLFRQITRKNILKQDKGTYFAPGKQSKTIEFSHHFTFRIQI